jgi:putative peptidoglycan lipid II flippase
VDGGVARSAGVVSAAIALSRLTGLVREMLMARLFGAGQAYDAFLVAFRIPSLARDLLAEGVLSAAFVPVFARRLARDKGAAAELANLAGTAIFVAMGVVCLLGVVFSPQLVALLAPGFAEVPGKAELAATLARVMFPYLLLAALAAQAMGVLNATGRFGVPALASSWFNIGSVAVGVGLGYTVGRDLGIDPIVSMAVGVVAGGMLQLAWQAPSLWRAGFPFRPRWNPRHPGLREALAPMGPAVLGGAAVQVNVMVNMYFASSIADASGQVIDGPVSWLGYAFRFMQLPLGVFGVAIASATLPAIARSAAAGRMEEFRSVLRRSLNTVLLLTIPSSVGLMVLGGSMIGAVYESGRFGPFDTQQTALALSGYALGLAGYSAIKLLAPALYALNDARSPMLVSLLSIWLNLSAAYALVRWAKLGHFGLALSTALVALAGAAALAAILSARTGGIGGRALASGVVRIAAASAVMGVATMASSHAVRALLGASRAACLADVAVSVPVGVAVFCAAGRLLHAPELARIQQRSMLHFLKRCFPT